MDINTSPRLDALPDASCAVERDEQLLTFRLAGEFDIAARPMLEERFGLAASTGVPGDVCVDLCAVTFIDSTVIACLVGLHRAVKARNGTLRVVCQPDGVVSRILSLSGVAGLFDLTVRSAEPS